MFFNLKYFFKKLTRIKYCNYQDVLQLPFQTCICMIWPQGDTIPQILRKGQNK